MEIKVDKHIIIRTIPYNWVIVENGKDIGYYDDLKQVINRLSHRISNKKLAVVFGKAKSLLNLSKGESFSAWYLTKIKHHSEFTKKVSPKSLSNLKTGSIRSVKRESLGKRRVELCPEVNFPIK